MYILSIPRQMGFFLAISLVLVQLSYSFRQGVKSLLKPLLFLADKTTDMNPDDPDKKSLHFFLYGAGSCNESNSCCGLNAPRISHAQCESTIASERSPCEGSKVAEPLEEKPSATQNLCNFRGMTSGSCAHESPSFHGKWGYMKRPMATELCFYSLSNQNPKHSGESKASHQSDKSNHSSFRGFGSREIHKTSCEKKDLYKGKAVLEINHIGSCHVTDGEASNQVSSSYGKSKSAVKQHSLELQNGIHQRRSYSQQRPRGSSRGLQPDSGRRKSDSDSTFQRDSWRSANSNLGDCLHVRSSELFSPYIHRNRAHPKGHGKNKPSSIAWDSPTVALAPVFGDWDESDPRSGEGFTYMFEKIKEERELLSSKFPDLLPVPINYKSRPVKQRYKISASKIFCCLGFKKKEGSAR